MTLTPQCARSVALNIRAAFNSMLAPAFLFSAA